MLHLKSIKRILKMKIVCISDSHTQHRALKIPECNLLIHAGDLTYKGELDVIEDFFVWLREVPATYKAIIFGNHELNLDHDGPKRTKALEIIEKYTDDKTFYLENSGVEIEGYNVWGSP